MAAVQRDLYNDDDWVYWEVVLPTGEIIYVYSREDYVADLAYWRGGWYAVTDPSWLEDEEILCEW